MCSLLKTNVMSFKGSKEAFWYTQVRIIYILGKKVGINNGSKIVEISTNKIHEQYEQEIMHEEHDNDYDAFRDEEIEGWY